METTIDILSPSYLHPTVEPCEFGGYKGLESAARHRSSAGTSWRNLLTRHMCVSRAKATSTQTGLEVSTESPGEGATVAWHPSAPVPWFTLATYRMNCCARLGVRKRSQASHSGSPCAAGELTPHDPPYRPYIII